LAALRNAERSKRQEEPEETGHAAGVVFAEGKNSEK